MEQGQDFLRNGDRRAQLVGLLIPDGGSLLNIARPAEAFFLTERELLRQPSAPAQLGPLRTVAISIDGGPIRTSPSIFVQTISLKDASALCFDAIAVIGGVALL